MLKQLFGILAAVALASQAEDVIRDETYNLPPAVAANAMGIDAAMKKMETAVKPEVLDAFKKAHPAPCWFFGEDRQLAVRNGIIPAHWFENGARQHGQFAGIARPGEFYVFQAVFLQGDFLPAEWRWGIKAEIDSLPGAAIQQISRKNAWDLQVTAPGKIQPLWFSIQIPADAKPGEYRGSISVKWVARDKKYEAYDQWRNQITSPMKQLGTAGALYGSEGLLPPAKPAKPAKPTAKKVVLKPEPPVTERETKLQVVLKVEGGPLPESGTGEAWRLARLKWLDSTIGSSNTDVTRPFTPIVVEEKSRTLDILGRRIALGENGIPAQYTSFFSGSNTRILKEGRQAFAAPPRLDVVVAGKVREWKPKSFRFTGKSPTNVAWTAVSVSGDLELEVFGSLGFDGCLQLRMQLAKSNMAMGVVDDIRLVIPWTKEVAKYSMGLGLPGGFCPDQYAWKWDAAKHQDAIWLGDASIGAMLRFKGSNYRRPLINAYYDFQPLKLPDSWGAGRILLEKTADAVVLTANSGPKGFQPSGKLSDSLAPIPGLDVDWYFTPFKPLDTKTQFTERYYHGGVTAGNEDLAELKKAGVSIINIHQNRRLNPYINYPYNDDTIGVLSDYVRRAHAAGLRVKAYYTTRELTQNLPEFFALRSLGGEVILPRRDGVAWPVTNPQGPHPWLQQHVGLDIVPAWRETLDNGKLDLAVITTPDSRWNNFYLEGLNFLVKKTGIDGIYIDDTALDRASMQRARRILDADGNTGRRVDMHSWNHFNGLAAWANSSIAFMELYPYYDRLWHGEGFNANSPPEFMLVEMSGIPYGLMSEMLDNPNDWHGMVFGMTRRWPWSGDPRPVWKLMDLFGIADAEFIGWWDPACPVKGDNPQVKVSVYRQAGKTMIALASWAPKPVKVNLTIDWPALGLDPKKTTLWAPASDKFQPEAVFAAAAPILVKPGKGWLLIADETPRQVAPVADAADLLKGLTPKFEQKAPFEIAVPANTVKTQELPWTAGATIAVARLEPLQDAGQSWGVGLAVGWANGKYVQIHCRTDGFWGIRTGGDEQLEGAHAKGTAASVAIKVGEKQIEILAQEDNGDWESIARVPRADYPGMPTTIKIGKIGQTWKARDHGDPGGTQPCRVDWLRLY